MKKCISCLYVYSSGNSKNSSSFYSCYSDYSKKKQSGIKEKSEKSDDIKYSNSALKVISSNEYSSRKRVFNRLCNTENKAEVSFIDKLGLKKINHIKKLDFGSDANRKSFKMSASTSDISNIKNATMISSIIPNHSIDIKNHMKSDKPINLIDNRYLQPTESTDTFNTMNDNYLYQSFGNNNFMKQIPLHSVSTIRTKESNQIN